MSLSNMMRGISGGFEVNRVIGTVGGFAYIFGAHAFVAWDTIAEGRPFDLTAYCLSFPAGLAAVVTGVAGAVAIKDRNVASARAKQAETDAPKPPTEP